ncbi:uncharacterized protein CEXT_425782 [Caerostris extrusa]|uniref:Transposase IS30-like HTH domain-containing protein n=1 Tax=Caerostris extrusa TaxID=172846 RepID=A0AAV4XXR2_CAEEX|nr:uncharacterized protein CEXT_425782 [Caerostris extrusa]
MDLKGKEMTPEERKIIIKLRNEGKTLREIGKIVGRTHSSIQRVINNYTSSKSIISKPRSGRPSKLTAREKRYVFKSHKITSKEMLKRVIITEWNNISSEETSKLVHSMPKRLTEVLRRRAPELLAQMRPNQAWRKRLFHERNPSQTTAPPPWCRDDDFSKFKTFMVP